MAKRLTRNIRSIKDIEKQPKYTNKQNDLLSDDKHVYVRNKDQYVQITGGVKEVNGETPDENGNVNLQTNDHNLLPGTSDEWETYEWETSYGWEGVEYSLEELGLKIGDTITFSKLLDNTMDDVDLKIWVQINFVDANGETLSNMRTSSIESGQRGYVKGTEKIPDDTADLLIYKVNKGDSQTAKTLAGKETKLQIGTLPTPEDIALKSELEQIKQAIINLGGEI
ncbi:BppU family phage baseplate upper protein [Tetragenococcus phage phiYA5_2]|nr:BppU family phage baseplate upper protein [Tetragenococcus phage phiYA5_2]